ncbi:MAG: GMC family oxidoreductase [Myxococcales bacterium]|nr:GMC family oxidoreductase [Myxococcales bacterium]
MTQTGVAGPVDVCVVGSGPASLSVAHELIGRDLRVCVVESGERHFEPASQELSCGNVVDGLPGTNLVETRARQVGGNSNLWCVKIGRRDRAWRLGVRYLPFADVDFEQRSWIPHSGWPFGFSDLQPHYQRAVELAQVSDAIEPITWQAHERDPFGLDGPFEGRLFRFGPGAAFHQNLRAAVEATPGFTLLPGHTVVRIERKTDSPYARCAHLRTASGDALTLDAKVFVLAGGGVENARLLLVSRDATGVALGNGHDMVGRGFMDHPLLHVGNVVPHDVSLWREAGVYDFRDVNGALVHGYARLSRAAMERHHVLGAALSIFPRPVARHTRAIDATRSLVTEVLSQRRVPPRAFEYVRDIMKGADALPGVVLQRLRGRPPLPGFGRGGWSEQARNERRYHHFEVMLQLEQAPDFDNRVMLSEDSDRFGVPLPTIRARLGDLDTYSIETIRNLIADAVAGAGRARFEPSRGVDGAPFPQPVSMAHHVGSTRMGTSPATSVVDPDGCLHEVPNIYVTGSSVFPTSSYANPTLTIVAVAARLGAHLARTLQQAPRVQTG